MVIFNFYKNKENGIEGKCSYLLFFVLTFIIIYASYQSCVLHVYKFIKKRLQRMSNFLRALILENICKRLFMIIFILEYF